MSDLPPNSAPAGRESLFLRLLWMVILGVLMGVGQMLINVLAVVQIILMALNNGQRNHEIARFGGKIGLWLAKSARFQTASSELKPWPWSPLD